VVTGTEGIRHYFESNLTGAKRYVSVLTDTLADAVSEDVAIVTALNKITITDNNQTELAMGRLSIALRKHADGWKIVHFHRSAMPA
jgi:ketosteroid isomerase-like protein